VSEDKGQKTNWSKIIDWVLIGIFVLAALVICALTLAIGFL